MRRFSAETRVRDAHQEDCAKPETGALGGIAQKVGGPMDKEGAIGKQFTADGAIGGKVQDMMGGNKGRSN